MDRRKKDGMYGGGQGRRELLRCGIAVCFNITIDLMNILLEVAGK